MQTEFDYRAMGRRMRDCRAGLGLTQEELAEKAGISASFVGHIERGEKQASVETVVALSKCLEISLDCLLLGRKRLCDPDDCRLREDLQKLVDTYPMNLNRTKTFQDKCVCDHDIKCNSYDAFMK